MWSRNISATSTEQTTTVTMIRFIAVPNTSRTILGALRRVVTELSIWEFKEMRYAYYVDGRASVYVPGG